MKDFTALFLKVVEKDNIFNEAVDIVQKNCEGDCWLIGGFIYRNIASELYGTKKVKSDLDFIVEKMPSIIKLPKFWSKKLNIYGNPKFVKDDGSEIDFIPLESVVSIVRRKLKPKIGNFLTGTPLTIQSIAYNIKNKKIIGKMGLQALTEKTIAPNNKEQLKIYADRKHTTVRNIILEKALDLNFKPIFR